jgi:hypothetical protein
MPDLVGPAPPSMARVSAEPRQRQRQLHRPGRLPLHLPACLQQRCWRELILLRRLPAFIGPA